MKLNDFHEQFVDAKFDFEEQLYKLKHLNRLHAAETTTMICPICQDTLKKKATILECAHSFCTDCWDNFRSHNRASSARCPLCRAQARELKVKKMTEEVLKEHEKITKQKNIEMRKKLADQFGAKVHAIITELRHIHTRGEKSIVFCMWDEILKLIFIAAQRVKLKVVNATTNTLKAIQQFKDDPEQAILLLPLRKCGKGLTLNQAQNVLMVEAPLSPSLYMQSIGRVHRIGQTKKTTVLRFAMAGSIEEQIWQFIDHVAAKVNIHRSKNEEKYGLTLNDFKRIFSPLERKKLPVGAAGSQEDAQEDAGEELEGMQEEELEGMEEEELEGMEEEEFEGMDVEDSDDELQDKEIPDGFIPDADLVRSDEEDDDW